MCPPLESNSEDYTKNPPGHQESSTSRVQSKVKEKSEPRWVKEVGGGLRILFLLCGSEKAMALKSIFHLPENLLLYPARLIPPVEGQIQWLAAREAASLLANSL